MNGFEELDNLIAIQTYLQNNLAYSLSEQALKLDSLGRDNRKESNFS